MNKHELILSFFAALLLGAGITIGLNGSQFFAWGKAQESAAEAMLAPVVTIEGSPTPKSPNDSGELLTGSVISPPNSDSVSIALRKFSNTDIEDVLLLYNATNPSNFDLNFCRIAEYYGLLCKMLALDLTNLSDELLRDQQGAYFKLIGLSALTLQSNPEILTKEEIDLLRNAIEVGGVNLLISNIDDQSAGPLIAELTGGAFLGSSLPRDTHRDWIVSSRAPEITREFTGQVITPKTSSPQADFALTLDSDAPITPLISSRDDSGKEYQIFSRLAMGGGSIFLDAGQQGPSLYAVPLKDVYYDAFYFSQILPLMFTMRYALGDEVWHNDFNYANLTIDDPTLTEPLLQLELY